MPSLYQAQELPRLRAEFASLYTEFRNWLCWPDPSGCWYVLELGFWFRDTNKMYLFKADSTAEVRAWLRDFEQDAHAWQAARLAAGLPAGDPPVPDLPRVTPATLDADALTATMHQAATGLLPPDPPMIGHVPGLAAPGWLSGLPWAMLAELGGRPAGGCRGHRWWPGRNRTGRSGREHR